MERPQFAYTGASPEKGYVGYVNIQEVDGGVRFLVRSEGEDPVTASYIIPAGEALKLLHGASYGIATGNSPVGLFSGYDPNKRCFAYCGDERCNCEAGPMGAAHLGFLDPQPSSARA